MIQKVKQELLNNPDKLIELLEHYEFFNIKQRHAELRCANDVDGNPNAICIKLSDGINCVDYVRGIHGDIFSFIIKSRQTEFKEVFNKAKNLVGIDGYYTQKKMGIFDNLYNRIKKHDVDFEFQIYPESVLDKYKKLNNRRFLNDFISIKTQRKFGIRYNTESNSIVIPIRNPIGELIGVKLRKNYNIELDESKYIYEIPCSASRTLFGFSTNYNNLYNNDVIIGESEKFVMQCDSFGFNNAVGLGSSNLSLTQCKLLLSLNPKSIIFMMDIGLNNSVLIKNMDLINQYSHMYRVPIYYWSGTNGFQDKMSATDLGKDMFVAALNDIKLYEEENEICTTQMEKHYQIS